MIRKIFVFLAIASFLIMGCSDKSVKRGYECLSLGDYDMAIEFFNEELRLNPRHFEARVGMGKALLQKSYANNQDTVYWNQALVHLQAARSIEDREYIRSLLKDAWLIYGRNRLAAKDTLGALAAFTFVLDYDPVNVEALNLSGIIFSSFGLTEKTEKLFNEAKNKGSYNTDIIFNIGMLYFYKNLYYDAISLWKTIPDSVSQDLNIKYWISMAEKHSVGKKLP